MNNSKGQVTIFVILGLILIIGVSLYFYLTNKTTTPNTTIPQLTGDFSQVQSFVEGCVDQVGRAGIIELGRHGGYIDPLNTTYTLAVLPDGLTYNQYDQSESDMAFLNWRDATTGIPYWYYAKSTDNGVCWHCGVSTLTPTVDSMQLQLGLYVDNNLQSCLQNFSTFKAQGFDIESITNSTTTVALTNNDVDFYTNYTLQITYNDNTKYIEAFYKEVNIPLLQYYTIAMNITSNEAQNEYLDVYTLYLLGQYTGLDSNKLPPLSAYANGYDSVFWSKTNTRILFQSLLNSYTQYFRITGTKNDLNIVSNEPIESNMYTLMKLPMFSTSDINRLDLKDKEIDHIYANSPIYLNIRPSDGDLISPFVNTNPSDYSAILSSISPDQEYNFFYDISYPVIVDISDSRPGNEYQFIIALQANVKENKLLSDWLSGYGTIPWKNDYVSVYNNVPNGTTIIDSTTGDTQEYNQSNSKILPDYFCDKIQRVSGNVTLNTYDSITRKPLSQVIVTYGCGSYTSCNLGTTTYMPLTQESSFNGQMPLCSNGYVQLKKDGYLTKTVPLSTAYNQKQNLGLIGLEPEIAKTVTIDKYMVIENGTKFQINNSTNLSNNDSVIIILNKIQLNNFDTPWTQTLILGRDGTNTTTINLVPGYYTIDAQLLDYNGVFIPKDCKQVCVDQTIINDVFGGCNKWQKIPDDDINISVAMWGGIEFDVNNTFAVTAAELQTKNALQFHVVRMPDPKCLDDMNLPSQVNVVSVNYKSKLMPQFHIIT